MNRLEQITTFLLNAAKKGTEESSKRVIAMGSSGVLWASLGFFCLVAWYQVATETKMDTAVRDIIVALSGSIALLAGMLGRKTDG